MHCHSFKMGYQRHIPNKKKKKKIFSSFFKLQSFLFWHVFAVLNRYYMISFIHSRYVQLNLYKYKISLFHFSYKKNSIDSTMNHLCVVHCTASTALVCIANIGKSKNDVDTCMSRCMFDIENK